MGVFATVSELIFRFTITNKEKIKYKKKIKINFCYCISETGFLQTKNSFSKN